MSSKPPNPFLDDDVDDEEFLNHPKQGSDGYLLGGGSASQQQSEWEDQRRQMLAERRKIEERTLQSTHTSIGLLHESEQVGILTAEELVRQREQLKNVDVNLDQINSTMKNSQKHINSIKSIFGGLKNYFSKGGQSETTATSSSSNPKTHSESPLAGTLDTLKTDTRLSEATHPALRIRGNLYDEPDQPGERHVSPPPAYSSAIVDQKIDENLDFMSMGLGRLKGLAIGLNEEIEQHNELIDSIHNKADKADETLEYQNRQIKRILKK